MTGRWTERIKYRLNLPGAFQARFFTLYEDGRDAMSDCLAPSWEATTEHRIYIHDISTQFSGLDPILTLNVSKAVGNQLYKWFKAAKTPDATTDLLDLLKEVITRNGTIVRNIGWHGDITNEKELTTCNA